MHKDWVNADTKVPKEKFTPGVFVDREDEDFSHAHKRAKERYFLELSLEDLDEIVSEIKKLRQDIKTDRVELIERKSKRKAVYRIEIKGVICEVLFDSQQKAIKTFLWPKDIWQRKQRRNPRKIHRVIRQAPYRANTRGPRR